MVNVWTNTVSIPWSEVGQGIGGLHLWPQAQQWRLERLAWTYVGMLLGIYLRVYWFIPNIQTFICMDELLNEKNATRFSHLIFGLFEFDLLQFPEKKSISSHYLGRHIATSHSPNPQRVSVPVAAKDRMKCVNILMLMQIRRPMVRGNGQLSHWFQLISWM